MAEVRSILATDCGSTTTKAILIEKRGEEYRLINRGEAPTTVEAPFDDVTIGVLNATRELEDLTGRELIQDGKILTPQTDEKRGVDLYLSTSSAGGGLQMMVMGVVRQMSAESAQRAALGAGAIIMDVIAIDDGRKDYQKIQRLRELRPDIVLLSGGTDGGTITHLVELGELLIAADPRPRFGTMNLPVIFAGNKDAREEIQHLLGERFDLRIVDNLRPELDREHLGPAREAIHELFLEHVMQQAPGYSKLMTWTSADIMSTPNAVGKIMVTIAEQRGINILGVDIGGATTDVFSVFDGNYTRTVSANLGMSYSICNVMLEAGIQNIRRWLPFDIEEYEVRNRLRNKMIRPTTIPQTYEDLLLEQAVSREALRLAFIHHKQLARGLKGVQQQRTIGEALEQAETGKTLVQMMTLDMIIGSGGVLSHAPKRAQSALMMMDAYQPEGVTMLAVDSIFMMPQLGVLSTVHPEAAAQVFDRDCLIRLGSCVAPVGQGKEGEPCLTIEFNGKNETFRYGELRVLPLGVGETLQATLRPARGFDIGAGKGKPAEATLEGGVVGVVVDARGRPLQLPQDDATRRQKLLEWMSALGLPKP
ncbi:MAG: glutamate mutase L [Fimbriimonadales bacterium]|nr:glutamate mutase L [Fimbriimonadales bacterium]